MVPYIREQLRTFVGTRRKVRLTRAIPSEPLHNGFVVDVGEFWVAMHQFHDFDPDGFSVFRLADVTDIRSGEYERFWERMLESEGTLDALEHPGELPLDDLASLLAALKRRDGILIVECEDSEEAIQDFYIGELLAIEKDFIWFANFDALGKWDDIPHRIRFEEITKLQFETRYARVFSKYLERPSIRRRLST